MSGAAPESWMVPRADFVTQSNLVASPLGRMGVSREGRLTTRWL